jgi:hypothetical protein
LTLEWKRKFLFAALEKTIIEKKIFTKALKCHEAMTFVVNEMRKHFAAFQNLYNYKVTLLSGPEYILPFEQI